MDFDAVISAPFGQLGLRAEPGVLREIVFLLEKQPEKAPTTPLLREAAKQLHAYFQHPDAQFDLPLCPVGTAFQQRVWQALSNIPIGTTCTYGELAKKIQTAPRALGQACGSNPLPIIIPCHRVVSASGQGKTMLGGFMHSTDAGALNIKYWLLQHERR